MINSVNNERIIKYSKLLEKKYRDEENLFLVSTDHLVSEAINSNLVVEIFLLEGTPNKYGEVTIVTESVIRKLTDLKTIPNVVAVVKKPEMREIKGNVLLLDSIQDPGNMGTIIRSSVAFNIDTIIVGDNSVDIYNEKVLRASEGMIFNINIKHNDLYSEIGELKRNGYKVIGTSVVNGTDISSINVEKYALLVGNEGNGVSKDLLELCDDYVYIKMNEYCESLNVGVATSILLYELNKKVGDSNERVS